MKKATPIEAEKVVLNLSLKSFKLDMKGLLLVYLSLSKVADDI